jgi:hypothetical protein
MIAPFTGWIIKQYPRKIMPAFFLAVRRDVFSLVGRLTRMLHVLRSETDIAFL